MFSLIFFAHCLLALLFLDASNAVPLLVQRQASSTSAPLSQPTTVMTVSTSMTPAGPLTQTCVITLTPVKDSNGQPVVEEVKNCTVAMNVNNNSNSTSSSSSGSSGSSSASASSSSTGSSSSSSDSGSSSTPASAPAASSNSGSSSTSASAPAVNSNGAISVDGAVTTMSALTPSTQTSSAGASASTTTASSAGSSTGSSAVSGASGSSSSASATTTASGSSSSASATTTAGGSSSSSATAAADNSNPSASSLASNQSNQQLAEQTYVVPGKSLQVLPIGLGVFAGISALALIVVGLVTYERTKYRKAFRQRKLAEQGAAMGYSR